MATVISQILEETLEELRRAEERKERERQWHFREVVFDAPTRIEQPVLFDPRDDRRPAAERTAAGRYREPSLFSLPGQEPESRLPTLYITHA